MKKALIAILLAAPILIGGCNTIDSKIDVQEGIVNATPYIRPSIALICNVVLKNATSGQDQIDKAKIINSIASVVASLADGKCPTSIDVEKAIQSVAPDKKHWASMASSIGGVYDGLYKQYIKGDSKIAADVLAQISLGCVDATNPYLE